MNKILLLLMVFFSIGHASFGQTPEEKIMYIVDSIPVMDDPEDGNEILQGDVADMTVIKNKDTLNLLGYGQFDGAIYLFTKEYRARPESIKQIPSSKQMQKINGVYFLHGAAYSGRFIDYYYSGKKQGEGMFADGKLEGFRTRYFQNGKPSVETNFKEGLHDGPEKEYYDDGTLKQEGAYKKGKEDGIWEEYYPNRQVKLYTFYDNGEITDSAFKYYSTGKIKEKVFIKKGNVADDPALVKINQLMSKSNERNKDGDTKEAIKYCTKAIQLDSSFAEAYFSRGTLKLNDFKFDEAIADFDKALQIEPYMEFALANRAFARIRKYQFASSRTLSKNSEVTVLAASDKVPVPKEEQEKICNDLHKAVFLGDKSAMITEALTNYCPVKNTP